MGNQSTSENKQFFTSTSTEKNSEFREENEQRLHDYQGVFINGSASNQSTGWKTIRSNNTSYNIFGLQFQFFDSSVADKSIENVPTENPNIVLKNYSSLAMVKVMDQNDNTP